MGNLNIEYSKESEEIKKPIEGPKFYSHQLQNYTLFGQINQAIWAAKGGDAVDFGPSSPYNLTPSEFTFGFTFEFTFSQALKLFLPFIHKKLMSLITDSTIKEGTLDKEVLWNLQMMSEIVRSNGQELIKYKTLLVDVLAKSLRMTCKQG